MMTNRIHENGQVAEAFLSKAELAAHLKITKRTITNWHRAGLPHYKFGSRRCRYKASEVDAWLTDKCRVGGQ